MSRCCNTQPCSVDCVVSAWSAWSACSAACGGGTQTATLTILTGASNGGTACPAATSQPQPCNTCVFRISSSLASHALRLGRQPCPCDCVASGWSEWSECSASCGGGTQYSTQTVTTPSSHGELGLRVLLRAHATCRRPRKVALLARPRSSLGAATPSRARLTASPLLGRRGATARRLAVAARRLRPSPF